MLEIDKYKGKTPKKSKNGQGIKFKKIEEERTNGRK